MNSIYLRIYLYGHSGKVIPRSVRRVLAGTHFHRALLYGYLGFFEQNGIKYGPAYPYPKFTTSAGLLPKLL